MKPISDPDTPWHLKTGEYIVQNKYIPQEDPFSYADDTIPFIGKFILTQYWLAQILFFIIHKTFGPFGLVITGAVIFTIISALLWRLIREKGFYISLLIIVGFTSYVLKDFVAIRPQIMTFLFTTLVLFLLETFKEKKTFRYLFPLPFVMLLWANMHGGFIYGVVIISFYMVAVIITSFRHKHAAIESNKYIFNAHILKFVAIAGFSIIISLANPNTYKAFLYAFSTQSIFAEIVEYKSPYEILKIYPSRMVYSFWLFIPTVLIMGMIFIKKRVLLPLALILFSLTLSLMSIRYISLFAIVLTATFRYIPVDLKHSISARKVVILNLLIIVSLTLLIFITNPFKTNLIYRFNNSPVYAVQASEFLAENKIFGNIFCSYNKSAFIIYTQYPHSKIFGDSRFISEERMLTMRKIVGMLDLVTDNFESINTLIQKDLGTINLTYGKQEDLATSEELSSVYYNKNAEKNWKDLLDETHTEIIVHEAINEYGGDIYPFIFKLIREDIWKLVYADGNVMIFVKDIDKFQDIIRKFALPKSTIYDEIIRESLERTGKNNAKDYSNIALALLLKGKADKATYFFIETALSLEPENLIANYSLALYKLMTNKKN